MSKTSTIATKIAANLTITMHRNQPWWIDFLRSHQAFWQHDEYPNRPHIRLSPTHHTNGFVDTSCVVEDPSLLDQAAGDLVDLVKTKTPHLVNSINRVVSSFGGSITLAHDIARNISQARSNSKRTRNNPCFTSHLEKQSRPGVLASSSMDFKGQGVRTGELVLIAANVISTHGNIGITAELIAGNFGYVADVVTALVNRSESENIGGRKIIALINKPIPIWVADKCPLCVSGSTAIDMKEAGSWDMLTAKY